MEQDHTFCVEDNLSTADWADTLITSETLGRQNSRTGLGGKEGLYLQLVCDIVSSYSCYRTRVVPI